MSAYLLLPDDATVDLTIPAGQTESGWIDLTGRALVGVQMPPAWDSAVLTFKAHPDIETDDFGIPMAAQVPDILRIRRSIGINVFGINGQGGDWQFTDSSGLKYAVLVDSANGTLVLQGYRVTSGGISRSSAPSVLGAVTGAAGLRGGFIDTRAANGATGSMIVYDENSDLWRVGYSRTAITSIVKMGLPTGAVGGIFAGFKDVDATATTDAEAVLISNKDRVNRVAYNATDITMSAQQGSTSPIMNPRAAAKLSDGFMVVVDDGGLYSPTRPDRLFGLSYDRGAILSRIDYGEIIRPDPVP